MFGVWCDLHSTRPLLRLCGHPVFYAQVTCSDFVIGVAGSARSWPELDVHCQWPRSSFFLLLVSPSVVVGEYYYFTKVLNSNLLYSTTPSPTQTNMIHVRSLPVVVHGIIPVAEFRAGHHHAISIPTI